MKAVRQLVRVLHGSHLYGTNTPASDIDYKGVHLPSGAAIFLQRAENVIDRKVKLSGGVKNNAGDIDDQSYSLQKFFGMLAVGDTVSTEILFAPTVVEADPEWENVTVVGRKLVNRQCKGFVGYCRRQAAKYGIKGSRMAACENIVALLERAIEKHGTFAPVSVEAEALADFCDTHEFSAIEIITSQAGTDVPHLEVVDRKVPYTASLKVAYEIYAKVYENYGSRARAAKNNEGIDWKAVSHAVRVARQAIELLQTGAITFPRPDAPELLAIKRGLIPYAVVAETLEALVEEVEEVAVTSPLPAKSDHVLIDRTVLAYYAAQGTEAGTAETQGGSVHDSPVAKPCAQKDKS